MGRAVERYPFPVAEWCRTIWASAEAQALWEPRIQQINSAWQAAELASVGVFREACMTTVQPDLLPELTQKAVTRGLDLIVLCRQGDSGTYQAGPVPLDQAASWAYKVALVTKAAAVPFMEAWRESDDAAMGEMLGFPSCCSDFFRRVWTDENWIDTSYPMAQGELVVAGPVECNILLRWLGVRWVPHLPCSFSCEGTADLGQQFRGLMGGTDVVRWMDELLDGPIQWSAWHGIAEIVTPVVKVSAKTDATGKMLVVRRRGEGYPEAGAAGLTFPYLRDPEKLRLVVEDTWSDNGFSSLRAMEAAHEVVVSAADSLTGTDYTVLDIGCGNGLLAKQMPGEEFFGIESDPARADSARSNGVAIVGSGLEDIQPEMAQMEGVSLVLFMPGRLIEEDSHVRALAALRGADVLLVYAYGDWLDKQGSLENLCRVARMKGELTGERTGPGVAAGIWRWSDDE